MVDREPCIHCGVLIAKQSPVSLRTLMLLGKLPPDSRVDKIVELEGVSREIAQDYVDHRMRCACVKTQPPCPACRAALKTWHATGCWGCGWRRDPARFLTDYLENGAGARVPSRSDLPTQ